MYITWNKKEKNTQTPYVHVGNEREMKKSEAAQKKAKFNKKKPEEISIPSRQVQAATSPQIDSFKHFILYTFIFTLQAAATTMTTTTTTTAGFRMISDYKHNYQDNGRWEHVEQSLTY